MGLPERTSSRRDRIHLAHNGPVGAGSSRSVRGIGLWTLLAGLLLLLGLSALYHPVTLQWKESTSHSVGLVYNIYRASSPCAAASSDKTLIATTAERAVTDRSIKFGTFCYTVRASLNGVESIDSNTAEVQIRPSLRHR